MLYNYSDMTLHAAFTSLGYPDLIFLFCGGGKNEGLGHRLDKTCAVRQHSGRIVLGDHKNASRQDDS